MSLSRWATSAPLRAATRSTRIPSRNAASDTTMRSIDSRSTISARRIAPPTMMSRRSSSSPAIPARSAACLRSRIAATAFRSPPAGKVSPLLTARAGVLGGDDPRQVEDRPRAADGGERCQTADVGDRQGQERPHVGAILGDRLGVDLTAREEAIGQADRPELQRSGEQHVGVLTDDQLGAATADVDHQDPFVEQRDEVQHAEVDEAPPRRPTRCRRRCRPRPRPSQELVPVERLAQCARRDGVDRGAKAIGDATKPPEGLDPALDRRRCQIPHHAGTRSETYDLLLPVEHVEVPVRSTRATTRWNELVPRSIAARISPSPARSGVTVEERTPIGHPPILCRTTGRQAGACGDRPCDRLSDRHRRRGRRAHRQAERRPLKASLGQESPRHTRRRAWRTGSAPSRRLVMSHRDHPGLGTYRGAQGGPPAC